MISNSIILFSGYLSSKVREKIKTDGTRRCIQQPGFFHVSNVDMPSSRLHFVVLNKLIEYSKIYENNRRH